jgi:hypothetical protein
MLAPAKHDIVSAVLLCLMGRSRDNIPKSVSRRLRPVGWVTQGVSQNDDVDSRVPALHAHAWRMVSQIKCGGSRRLLPGKAGRTGGSTGCWPRREAIMATRLPRWAGPVSCIS